MKKIIVLCLLYMTVATPAFAAPLKPIPSLKESYSDPNSKSGVKVSGSMFMGALRGASNQSLDLSQAMVNLSVRTQGQLCVKLTTRDGRYTGEQGYQVADSPQSLQPLGINSSFQNDLKRYRQSDLAIRAQVRETCGVGKAGYYIPAVFPGQEHANLITVFLNTKNAAAKIAVIAGAAEVSVTNCKSVDADASVSKTAFDKVCVVNIPTDIWEKVTAFKIVSQGNTGGSYEDVIKISLGPA